MGGLSRPGLNLENVYYRLHSRTYSLRPVPQPTRDIIFQFLVQACNSAAWALYSFLLFLGWKPKSLLQFQVSISLLWEDKPIFSELPGWDLEPSVNQVWSPLASPALYSWVPSNTALTRDTERMAGISSTPQVSYGETQGGNLTLKSQSKDKECGGRVLGKINRLMDLGQGRKGSHRQEWKQILPKLVLRLLSRSMTSAS